MCLMVKGKSTNTSTVIWQNYISGRFHIWNVPYDMHNFATFSSQVTRLTIQKRNEVMFCGHAKYYGKVIYKAIVSWSDLIFFCEINGGKMKKLPSVVQDAEKPPCGGIECEFTSAVVENRFLCRHFGSKFIPMATIVDKTMVRK